MLPNRYTGGSDYRYGFNGMEHDDEVKTNSNSYTTHFRSYDPRLGKWLSVDPLTLTSPWHSPYQGFSNNPVLMVDPAGDKEWASIDEYAKANNGSTELGKYDWLTSDRHNNTNVYQSAMAAITKDMKMGEFKPFAEVEDYYKWVDKQLQDKGHEIRWTKGAIMLVHDLADAYQADKGGGFTTGAAFAGGKTRTLLEELNIGIAEYAIGKFNELLYGKHSTLPLVGDDAFEFDVEFIKAEQGKVAYSIYSKYSVDGIAVGMMDKMARKEGLVGTAAAWAADGYVPSFSDYGVSLKKDRYGEAGRIEIPILMLYPSKYKPTLTKGLMNKTDSDGFLEGEALKDFQKANKILMK